MKRILLVDDNDAVRKVLRLLLEANGFDVCGEAADGSQAVAKAKELKPDLILLDRSMPQVGRCKRRACIEEGAARCSNHSIDVVHRTRRFFCDS
jgi:CheY-like chemotaxis protein